MRTQRSRFFAGMTMPGPRKLGDLKKFAAFGSSVGIEISGKNLEITAVRGTPNGSAMLGAISIRGFLGHLAPAGGAEYTGFFAHARAPLPSGTRLHPGPRT